MKSRLYLFITVFCLGSASALAQAKRLPEVTIEWENLNTRTFVAVSCDDFQSNFAATIKRADLSNKAQLKRAGHLQHRFLPVYGPAMIDTRGKIIFKDVEGMTIQYVLMALGIFQTALPYGKIISCGD